jgi:hypothetical protein
MNADSALKNVLKISTSLLKVQRILVKVFENPAGRLTDNLCQLSANFYSLAGAELLQEKRLFEKLVKNDLKLMEGQNICSFNPALLLAQKMLGKSKTLDSYITNPKYTMYPQLFSEQRKD